MMMPDKSRFLTPLRILVITIAGIFVAEVIAMIVVYMMRPLPYSIQTLIDATIMVVLIFPVVYFLSFRPLLTNIEKRKKVESDLRESNEFLEKMFSITHVLIAYLDTEFDFIQVNQAYAAADERSPEFYIGKNHFDLFPNEENEAIFRKVVETGIPYHTFAKPFEYAEHPERQVTYWDWSLIPTKSENGDVTGVVLSLIDVTERVKAEMKLVESERRFQAIFNQTFQLMALIAPDGTVVEANQTALDFIGKKRSEVVGIPIWEALVDNVSPRTNQRLRKVVEQAVSGQFVRYEGELFGSQNRVIFVDYSLKPVENDQGDVVFVIAEGRDTTERKQMEKALEQERQRLFALLDHLPAFVALQSPDYTIQFANQQFHKNFGPPDGRRCYEIMLGLPEPCEGCLIPKVISEKLPQTWEKTYTDGKTFQVYGYPFYDFDGSTQVIELGVDITENKKAQERINQHAARSILLAETLKTILEAGPDYQAVLDAIVSSVDLLGDGCLIRLVSEDGLTHAPVAFHHSDPKARQILDEVFSSDIRPIQSGVTGYVVETGQPLFFPHFDQENIRVHFLPTYHEYINNLNVHSLLTVPLRANDKLIGSLSLFRNRTKKPYAQDDLDFAQSLADQAALAIQNAHLYKAEWTARQTAEILCDASLALTQTLNLDIVVDEFLNYASKLVLYDHAAVLLVSDDERPSVRATRGSEEAMPIESLLQDSKVEPFIQELLSKHKTTLISDISQVLNFKSCVQKDEPFSWLIIPLIAAERVIGLSIFCKLRSKSFSEQQVLLLEALVGQVSVTIQNAWLFEQVRAGRERMQSLSRRLVEIQESERRYIARELHDEASQALSSLMVGLRLIERDAELPESVMAGAGELKTIADGVIENLHRLAMDLRPASLDHLGLVAALRQHAEEISDRHHIAVQFEAVDMDERLPPDTETAIYRIVQEAVSNVILHAQAMRVDIVLEKRGNKVIAIVEDNGIGFNPSEIAQRGRLGLVGIQERADLLGGTLLIESESGKGTTLILDVPYGD